MVKMLRSGKRGKFLNDNDHFICTKPSETQLRSKVLFIRKKCSQVHWSTLLVFGVDPEATARFDDKNSASIL